MPSLSRIVEDDIPRDLRLDRYVAERLGLLSRSQLKVRGFTALLGGRAVKLSRILRPGDRLELSWEDPAPLDLVPEDLPLDVLYEDERVIVVNKAQGMVVHPGAGNRRGTLANALLYRRPGGAGLRPGIVHRLDKDTSGVLIAAWDEEAQAFLAAQFKERRARKSYAALVRGTPREPTGRVETGIGRDPRDRRLFTVTPRGKPSLTLYRVVKTWGAYSLLLLRPKTGRTHQLRVHLRWLGHPILGDPLYGAADPRFPQATLMLHARRLSLRLPPGGVPRTFYAPFPPRLKDLLRHLRG